MFKKNNSWIFLNFSIKNICLEFFNSFEYSDYVSVLILYHIEYIKYLLINLMMKGELS